MSPDLTVPVPAEFTPRHLRVLILAAFHQVELDHLKDAMTAFLAGAAGRMMSGGAGAVVIDLSSLWSAMSSDDSGESGRVHHALWLVVLYLDSVIHAQVTVPEPMRVALAAVVPTEPIEVQLARLSAGVTLALNEAPAPVPALPPPVQVPVAPPSAPEVKQPFPQAAGPRARSRWVLWAAIAVAPLIAVMALNLNDDRGRASRTAAHLRLDPEALSAVTPIVSARISGRGLIVVLRDTTFATAPPERQKRIGRDLLAALNRDDIHTLFLTSGDTRFRCELKGQELTVSPILGVAAAANEPNRGEPREESHQE